MRSLTELKAFTDGPIRQKTVKGSVTRAALATAIDVSYEELVAMIEALQSAVQGLQAASDASASTIQMAVAAVALADSALAISQVVTELIGLVEGKVDAEAGARLILETEYQDLIDRLETLEAQLGL